VLHFFGPPLSTSTSDRATPTHLSAEGASVLAVLGDFHLLDHLTEGGTITGTIFTNDSNLLGALGLSIIEGYKCG